MAPVIMYVNQYQETTKCQAKKLQSSSVEIPIIGYKPMDKETGIKGPLHILIKKRNRTISMTGTF